MKVFAALANTFYDYVMGIGNIYMNGLAVSDIHKVRTLLYRFLLE